MKQKLLRFKIFFYFFIAGFLMHKSTVAQQCDCNFKPPVITIDFGTSHHEKDVDLSSLSNYNEVRDECPADGN